MIPFIDTDVIIRFLTGDDLSKQAAAAALFERVQRGEVVIASPVTVIADAVFVLASPKLYALDRRQIATALAMLVQLPAYQVQEKEDVLRALDRFANTNLDFGDVMLLATMERVGSTLLYSFDRDFDHDPNIVREEPSL